MKALLPATGEVVNISIAEQPVEMAQAIVHAFLAARAARAAVLGSIKPNGPDDGGQPQYCPRWPGLAYRPGADTLHRLNCKARHCPHCGKIWSRTWREVLMTKAALNDAVGKPVPSRAVGLTTAYDCGYRKLWRAKKYFWEALRRLYGPIQYWGVVEYNQGHDRPHLHIILEDDCFIPMEILRMAWRRAQRRAGFRKIAWNTRIEKINGNLAAYFCKYVTKATDIKDEVPRRENWRGRFVFYSRKFFPAQLATIRLAARTNAWLASCIRYSEAGHDPDDQSGPAGFSSALYSMRPSETRYFIQRAQLEYAQRMAALSRQWDYVHDRQNAVPLYRRGQSQEMEFTYEQEKRPPGSQALKLGAASQRAWFFHASKSALCPDAARDEVYPWKAVRQDLL